MTSDNLVHFENIWEEAEEIGKELKHSRQEIYNSIKKTIDDYAKLDHISAPEIAETLKTKKLGEALFLLAELSELDGVNTFAALSMENEIQKA